METPQGAHTIPLRLFFLIFNFSGRSQMIKSGMTVAAHCAKVKDIIKTVNPHYVSNFFYQLSHVN